MAEEINLQKSESITSSSLSDSVRIDGIEYRRVVPGQSPIRNPSDFSQKWVLEDTFCGHCWYESTQGPDCPLCRANDLYAKLEVEAEELKEVVIAQAKRLEGAG